METKQPMIDKIITVTVRMINVFDNTSESGSNGDLMAAGGAAYNVLSVIRTIKTWLI